jgi:hypothetical protein
MNGLNLFNNHIEKLKALCNDVGYAKNKSKVLIENKYEEIRVEKGGLIRAKIGGKEVILNLKDE